jgi:hypothetical protein
MKKILHRKINYNNIIKENTSLSGGAGEAGERANSHLPAVGHSTAEAGHSTAEAGHSTAEAGRPTVETVHSTTEAVHPTVEAGPLIAEAGHDIEFTNLTELNIDISAATDWNFSTQETKDITIAFDTAPSDQISLENYYKKLKISNITPDLDNNLLNFNKFIDNLHKNLLMKIYYIFDKNEFKKYFPKLNKIGDIDYDIDIDEFITELYNNTLKLLLINSKYNTNNNIRDKLSSLITNINADINMYNSDYNIYNNHKKMHSDKPIYKALTVLYTPEIHKINTYYKKMNASDYLNDINSLITKYKNNNQYTSMSNYDKVIRDFIPYYNGIYIPELIKTINILSTSLNSDINDSSTRREYIAKIATIKSYLENSLKEITINMLNKLKINIGNIDIPFTYTKYIPINTNVFEIELNNTENIDPIIFYKQILRFSKPAYFGHAIKDVRKLLSPDIDHPISDDIFNKEFMKKYLKYKKKYLNLSNNTNI